MNPGGSARLTIYRNAPPGHPAYREYVWEVLVQAEEGGMNVSPTSIALMTRFARGMGCVFEKGLMEEANLREKRLTLAPNPDARVNF